MESERIQSLLKKATGNGGGIACFAATLSEDAAEFLKAAVVAKAAGVDIKIARVARVLGEDFDVTISRGPVENHMKGRCKCPTT